MLGVTLFDGLLVVVDLADGGRWVGAVLREEVLDVFEGLVLDAAGVRAIIRHRCLCGPTIIPSRRRIRRKLTILLRPIILAVYIPSEDLIQLGVSRIRHPLHCNVRGQRLGFP